MYSVDYEFDSKIGSTDVSVYETSGFLVNLSLRTQEFNLGFSSKGTQVSKCLSMTAETATELANALLRAAQTIKTFQESEAVLRGSK